MDLRAASPTYDRVMKQFEAATEQLIASGIVEFCDPKVLWPTESVPYGNAAWDKARSEHRKQLPPLGDVFVRKLVKKVAKDLKRPLVTAETQYFSDRDGYTFVTIKRAAVRAPLVAQFLVLLDGNHTTPRRYAGAGAPPIQFGQDKINWYIAFKGRKGQRAFADWKQHCLTHPDCRRALDLPPLESELKLAA
jgi:hypothetical protein